MRQQQSKHLPRPIPGTIKEQLRERIQGHFAFPETITEGWGKADALGAIAELLEESNLESTLGLRKHRFLVVTLLILYLLLILWMFLQHKYRFIGTQLFTMPLATALFVWVVQKKNNPSSPYLPQQQVKLVQVLAALLVRVDEVRLVPQVLEAARRVPELPAGELRDAWWQVQEETLGRLLPRMTTGEAQALTEEQRAYLRHCLSRQLPEATVVAILLTLGSAGDQEVLSFAQHFLGQPFPRVQVAAQECLVALRQGATKP